MLTRNIQLKTLLVNDINLLQELILFANLNSYTYAYFSEREPVMGTY